MEISELLNLLVVKFAEAFGGTLIIGSAIILAVVLLITGFIYFETKDGPLVNGKLYPLYMMTYFISAAGAALWIVSSVLKSDIHSALFWSIACVVLAWLGRNQYRKIHDGPKSGVTQRVSNRERLERERTSQLDDDDSALKKILRDEK